MQHIQTNCELPMSLYNSEDELNDFDFVLFHLYDSNPAYKEHYLKKRGRKIILDCSAYEYFVRGESIDVDKYVEAINELKPDFYVLPDTLMSLPKTIVGVELFPRDKITGSKPMGVIQGNSESDMLKMLEYYDDLGIDSIAIPFHNSFFKDVMFETSPAWMRLKFIGGLENYLEKTFPITDDIKYAMGRCWFILKNIDVLEKFGYAHLLGSHCVWEKHFLEELQEEHSSYFIKSMDTGYPVKCAIKGYKLFEEPEKPNVIIDDFLEDSTVNDNLIKENIETFKNI